MILLPMWKFVKSLMMEYRVMIEKGMVKKEKKNEKVESFSQKERRLMGILGSEGDV